MKKITLIILPLIMACTLRAQKETFDVTTYTRPAGWKKVATDKAVQLSKTDNTKGAFCLISLSRSGDGSGDSRTDFNTSWGSAVKSALNVTQAPLMQDSAVENGWIAQTGYAPFEKDGMKGVSMLITMSSPDKLVNILILTNTDAYQKNITEFLTSISLKKPAPATAKKPVTVQTGPGTKSAAETNSGAFAFNQTNFDDGWVATEKTDWVEVKKEQMTILIHYPRAEEKKYYSVTSEEVSLFWNLLVAPRYSNIKNYTFFSNSCYDPARIGAATLTENATGKQVYVMLFKWRSAWMEIIAPDKGTFVSTFGIDIDKTDHFFCEWGPIARMNGYNRFAVGPNDLTGKWTNDFSGMTQYVNAFTGANAGMDTHSSSESFDFKGKNYRYDLGVASGMVGSIKFQSVISNGTWNMKGNWQIAFSDIEKKPRTYNAYFSCIKGARMLWLQDTGYGDYKAYGKK